MQYRTTGITDVGLRRDRNEDAYLINDEIGLFVIADGMGGHVGGQFASSIAVNHVESELGSDVLAPPMLEADPVVAVQRSIERVVQHAGRHIFDYATAHPELHGMGTTIVLLLIEGERAFIAHVGDSRLYAVRDARISQVTEDHSLVAQSVREGKITLEEARKHKMRNVITRALGFQESVEVDVQVRKVESGDCYLLCTDGLSNKLEPEELGTILLKYEPDEAARKLVSVACERGGEDNISAIIVHIDAA